MEREADVQMLEQNVRKLGNAIQSLSIQVASLSDRVDAFESRMSVVLDKLGCCLDRLDIGENRIGAALDSLESRLDQSSGQRVLPTHVVRKRVRPSELSGAQQFFRAAGKPTRYHTVRGYDEHGRKTSIFTGYYG